MLRRALLLALMGLLAGLTLGSDGARASASPDERSLGRADAPVTVVEYASVTCPHCARWHAEVFPAFKARYIDTGRVRLVYREFLTSPPELSAAGFMVARCAPPERYFDVIGSLMHGQQALYASGDARTWLLTAGQAGGLSEAQVAACVRSQPGVDALNTRLEAASQDGVDGTPTFIIGQTKLDGEQTLAQLDAVIAPLLRGR